MPATSVIAFSGPGVPSNGMPKSRARGFTGDWPFSVAGRAVRATAAVGSVRLISGPRARSVGHLLEHFVDHRDGSIDLFVRCVEVRRQTHARLRTPVDDHITLEQSRAYVLRVRHVDADGSTTP